MKNKGLWFCFCIGAVAVLISLCMCLNNTDLHAACFLLMTGSTLLYFSNRALIDKEG